MKIFKQSLSPEAILNIVGGELINKREAVINNVADAIEAMEHSVIFIDNDNYLPLVQKSKAGLILAGSKYQEDLSNHPASIIYCENAYQSMLILMQYWLKSEEASFDYYVHPTAIIGDNVSLPDKVYIGPYVIINDDVVIGEYTRIDAFCSIGNGTTMGKHCHCFPHVTLYADTIIGNNVILHSGSVIGADGFGYLLFEGIQHKIPQVGQVIIHDHVEIGANTTIDKGTIGSTVIGEGTKIDNLVQIGHNCKIGKHTILCAQVGLAGSTTIGDYVYAAGQVGMAGHLHIGDRVMIGAQSGVVSDLEPEKKYFGSPAREAMLTKKIMAIENSLPEMYKFYQKLKKEKELE